MKTPNPGEAIATDRAEYKYWAFISYSHRDAGWADWLHRKLENYRVPRALVGRASRNGPLPSRLIPIFRDRDELSASHDLGVYIKSSLFLSRHLVVICSPNSARSKWVDGEIRYFKSLGREDRLFCLIVDGEPDSADRECFPDAARFHLAPDGSSLPERAYPIAADARPHADGKTNALVKILAGLLDVNYDDLKQREKRRRLRQRLKIAALAGLILLSILGLWSFEENSKRQEMIAEYRQDAEQSETSARLKQACVYLAAVRPLLSPEQSEGTVWRGKLLHDSRALINESAILKGHENWVDYGTFSPDGRKILTCSWDSTVRLWDLGNLPTVTPRSVHTFKESSNDVFLCANYDPTGQEIVCTTWWSALCWVTDPDGGLIGRIIADHRGRVNYAEFNAQGTQFVTASDDCTARLWDAQGNPIRVFYGHTAGLKTAVFNPRGTRVLTASYDGTAKIWDVATGNLVTTVVAGGDKLNWAAFSPDGNRFVTAGLDMKARIWDLQGHLFMTFAEHGGRINTAMFNHRGDLVLTASDDGTAKVWNARDGALQLSLEGHDGPVLCAAFSPDDSLIVTTGKDRTVRLWRMSDAPPRDIDWPDFIARVKHLPWTLKNNRIEKK